MRRPLSPLLLIAVLCMSATAQFDSFDDFTWTFEGGDGASGTLSTDLMHVKGPDSGFCTGQTWAAYTTVAPWAGTVRVHVEFTIFDLCHFDWPVYVVNGVPTEFAVEGSYIGCWLGGPRDLEFAVSAGDTFGLGVGSADCWLGPGVTDWSQFSFQPRDWVDAGGALDPRLDLVAEPLPGTSGFATALASPGDVDGDGLAEVAVVSAPPGSPFSALGQVELRSGANGSVLWTTSGMAQFGANLVAPGDLSGDGTADLVASDSQQNAVVALSGLDGGTLWVASGTVPGFGPELAAFGDADSDGITDIAVATFISPATLLHVVSGADGGLISSMPHPPGFELAARSLGSAGDIDGDGLGDILVTVKGEPWKVLVLDGANGTILAVLEQQLVSAGLPWGPRRALGSSGDVDGDGAPDPFVGGPSDVVPGLMGYTGSVSLFSGASGALIRLVPGVHGDR